MELTGIQRFILMKLWLKNGMQGDPEVYIKKVCQAKGIKYRPAKAKVPR